MTCCMEYIELSDLKIQWRHITVQLNWVKPLDTHGNVFLAVVSHPEHT